MHNYFGVKKCNFGNLMVITNITLLLDPGLCHHLSCIHVSFFLLFEVPEVSI